MALLNVNIDHVATIRQARRDDEPSPVWAAVECELGGASGITMHLREDQRHIQPADVELVRQISGVMLNLEMALTPRMIRYALKVKPDQVTLVPEKREELTTEGGLNCLKQRRKLTAAVEQFNKARIKVSAFIDPDADQVTACAQAGCHAVELHTGTYSFAKTEKQIIKCLKDLTNARDAAWREGMIVHAGHGLTYRNIASVAQVEGIADFNIGHSIVSRSVFVGIRQATREMADLIDKYSRPPLD